MFNPFQKLAEFHARRDQRRREKEFVKAQARDAIRKKEDQFPKFNDAVGRISQFKDMTFTFGDAPSVSGCQFWLKRGTVHRPDQMVSFFGKINALDGHRLCVVYYVTRRRDAAYALMVDNLDSQTRVWSDKARELATNDCRAHGMPRWQDHFDRYVERISVPHHL